MEESHLAARAASRKLALLRAQPGGLGDQRRGVGLGARTFDAVKTWGCRRAGMVRLRAEFRLVPAAMLATPGAHYFAHAEGYPTDQPEAQGQDREHKMQRVIDLRLDEDLLVPAPWAVTAYFFLFHLAGSQRHELQRLPRKIIDSISHVRRMSKVKLPRNEGI